MADRRILRVVFTNSEGRDIPSAGRQYDYFVPPYITGTIAKGDHVVIQSSDRRMGLARVVDAFFESEKEHTAKHPIAGTVDDHAHRRRQELARREAELITALEALEEKRRQQERFRVLAEHDPEASQLLSELRICQRAAA